MSSAPVYIHDDGTGTPIVLLHAFPLDASMWDPQVAQLSGHHRCLRPDFWGCGESPPPGDDAGLDDFARAVLSELTQLGVKDFSLVGLSMGGYAALALMRLQPERVTKLVLAATRAGNDTEQGRAERRAMAAAVRSEGVDVIVESMLTRLLSPRGRTEIELTTLIRERMLHGTPAGIAACQEAMATRPDSTALLADIGVPTLLIAGGDDAIIAVEEVATMAIAIPGAQCTVIEDVGHLVNLEAPAAFGDLVDEFLDAE